jgi:hypothetical protein
MFDDPVAKCSSLLVPMVPIRLLIRSDMLGGCGSLANDGLSRANDDARSGHAAHSVKEHDYASPTK